jgi:hypothetical protein
MDATYVAKKTYNQIVIFELANKSSTSNLSHKDFQKQLNSFLMW